MLRAAGDRRRAIGKQSKQPWPGLPGQVAGVDRDERKQRSAYGADHYEKQNKASFERIAIPAWRVCGHIREIE